MDYRIFRIILMVINGDNDPIGSHKDQRAWRPPKEGPDAELSELEWDNPGFRTIGSSRLEMIIVASSTVKYGKVTGTMKGKSYKSCLIIFVNND